MLKRLVARSFSLLKQRESVKTSLPIEGTLLIELNRPKALNALCDSMISELNETLDAAEASPEVRTVVMTGSPRAFAAGADIKEMAEQTFSDTVNNNMLGHWDQITTFR